ncbi:hypothetical protein [Nonomuraea sp. NPDC049480]
MKRTPVNGARQAVTSAASLAAFAAIARPYAAPSAFQPSIVTAGAAGR